MDKIRDLREKFFLIDDEYLNGYAKLCGINATGVYLSLCRHANKNQQCFPSKKLVAEELAISERSVYTALKTLESWNIIRIETRGRDETGKFNNLLYTLLDKKVWKLKPDQQQHMPSANSAVGKTEQSPSANNDNYRRQQVPNKETHIKDTHIKVYTEGGEINELIDLFKTVNPSYKELFKNINQRKALIRLSQVLGWEKLRAAIDLLPRTNAERYAPTITTPIELEHNLGRLIAYVQRQQSEGPKLIKL
jgi:Helix-turn-helix domain